MTTIYVHPVVGTARAWWTFTTIGGFEPRLNIPYPSQRAAMQVAVRIARSSADRTHPYSVRVMRPNGRFREERTYPRSADPRRSKG